MNAVCTWSLLEAGDVVVGYMYVIFVVVGRTLLNGSIVCCRSCILDFK